MSDFSFTFSSDLFDDDGSQAAAKFNLYLKARELKQLSSTLHDILDMPAPKRRVWVDENQEMVKSLLDTCLREAAGVMDGVTLDQEALVISKEFVTHLRDTLAMLQSIVRDGKQNTAS